eukprot:g42394.t1
MCLDVGIELLMAPLCRGLRIYSWLPMPTVHRVSLANKEHLVLLVTVAPLVLLVHLVSLVLLESLDVRATLALMVLLVVMVQLSWNVGIAGWAGIYCLALMAETDDLLGHERTRAGFMTWLPLGKLLFPDFFFKQIGFHHLPWVTEVRLVLLVPLALLVPLVLPVLSAQLANKETEVNLVLKVQWVLLVLLVPVVCLSARLDKPALTSCINILFRVLKVLGATRAKLVRQVKEGRKVTEASLVCRVYLVL